MNKALRMNILDVISLRNLPQFRGEKSQLNQTMPIELRSRNCPQVVRQKLHQIWRRGRHFAVQAPLHSRLSEAAAALRSRTAGGRENTLQKRPVGIVKITLSAVEVAS